MLLIVSRYHREDTRQLFRLARVDANEPRMRVRSAQYFAVRHTRQFHVYRVESFAIHFLGAVGAQFRLADHPIVCCIFHPSTSMTVVFPNPIERFVPTTELASQLLILDPAQDLRKHRPGLESHSRSEERRVGKECKY